MSYVPPPPPRPPPPPGAIIKWQPTPEQQAAEEARVAILAAKQAQAAATLAMAKYKESHANLLHSTTVLVLNEITKYVKLSQDPDYANVVGPIDPKTIMKMAEFVSKNYRLDTGQSTENIAHAIGPSLDFSKLSQAERDAWRALAIKGGGVGEE